MQDAAGASLTYARDLSTERSYSAKVAGFRRFLTAMYDNPTEQIWFDADDIMMYMACWVDAGFSARTLKNNLTALRGYARRQRLYFPPIDSDGWRDINDMRKALIKMDPTDEHHASVLDLAWIEYIVLATPISCAADFWTCDWSDLIFVTRLLVAHACGMRACEHDHGCRLADIVSAHCTGSSTGLAGHVTFRVAGRVDGPADGVHRARKLKSSPARLCGLPIWDSHISAGSALIALAYRVHGIGVNKDWQKHVSTTVLFPTVRGPDDVAGAPQSSRQFMARVRAVLRNIGMPAAVLAGITGHSLRAGAATDYLEMNLPESFVRTQCGWAGESLRIYHRPQERHRWSASRRVFAAMQTAGF